MWTKAGEVQKKPWKIQDIGKDLKKTLNKKRYAHTLGVANTAACLAMCHGGDVNKAYLAGLLHDNAKCLSNKKKLSICEKAGLSVSQIEADNPELLHAKVGSYLAMTEYHINDIDILNAICYHTTGRPDMSLLEKIVFIADYIEPNRNPIPGLDTVRSMAFQDLEHTLLLILESTLKYIKKKGDLCRVDPMTQKTYEYYLSCCKRDRA